MTASTSPAATACLVVAAWAVTSTAAAQFAPAPPVGLTATVVSDTVTLAWLTSTGTPSAYVIEVGSGPGATDLGTLVVSSANTSFVAGAVPAGNYFARVRASSAAGMSRPSNEVVLSVGAACHLPAAPTNLSAAVAANQLTLQWGSTGGAIRLEAGSGPGSTEIFTGDIGAVTTISASVPMGFYVLRVRERNACGLGPASPETVVSVGVPAAPVALTASVISNAITLRWTPPPSGAATGYTLSAGSAPWLSDIATAPLGNQTLLVAPGVPVGTYYVRVQASGGGPLGPPSNDLAVTVGPAPAGTSVVTFNSLPLNGPAFVTHSEAGLTVDAVSGPWTSGPALVSRNTTNQTPLDSEVKVTADSSAPFRLASARLYSSITPIPYIYRGVANGLTVYTAVGTVPNTFGAYATVPNPFADVVVDAVYITVTNPAIPTCPTCTGNPVGIDDIVVRRL